MSLERDVTAIQESFQIKEGLARAKELYVDTDQMNMRQLNTLSGKDPTPQKKYIEWMARMYTKGHRNMRQYNEIKDFDELCVKNQIENKDINTYENPEQISDAVRQAQRKLAQKKQVKKFVIDEEILKPGEINPSDIVFQNKYVVVVKPVTTEMSQKYGRNHRCDPNDPHSATAYWCTSTTSGYNRFLSYFQSSGDTFYIILPKNIDYVPEEKYTKVNVQVAAVPRGAGATVWDFFDHTMERDEAERLFQMWKVPSPYKKKTQEEEA